MGELGENAKAIAVTRGISPTKLPSALAGELDWITLKAIAKDRGRRYATANALALDVRRHLQNEPVSAGPPGATYRAVKFVRRNRVLVSATVGALAAVFVFTGLLAVQARRLTDERDRASHEAATTLQVTNFFVGLFKLSDPAEARGRDLTAKEILNEGAKRLNNLQNEPEIQARLQATIGDVYAGLGLYREAVPLLESALQTISARSGPTHMSALPVIETLGTVYWSLGRAADAEKMFRTVLEVQEKVSGKESRETLAAKSALAVVYLEDQARWLESEKLLTDTLNAQTRVLGPDDPGTLSTTNSLQNLFFRQKR